MRFSNKVRVARIIDDPRLEWALGEVGRVMEVSYEDFRQYNPYYVWLTKKHCYVWFKEGELEVINDES